MTTQSERVDAYAETTRYHRPWYWYDWANSAFVTTVGTVLFGPYLTSVAKQAACPGQDSDAACSTDLYVIPAADGLPSWVARRRLRHRGAAAGAARGRCRRLRPWPRAAGASHQRRRPAVRRRDRARAHRAPRPRLDRPLHDHPRDDRVGAAAHHGRRDRRPRPTGRPGCSACSPGSARAPPSPMFFVAGTQLAARRGDADHRPICAWAPRWSSTTPSCAASPARTTATRSPAGAGRWATSAAACSWRSTWSSSRKPDLVGADTGTAVRISLLSAGLWWAVFTLIPVLGLWSLRGNAASDLRRAEGRRRAAAAWPSSATPSATCATTPDAALPAGLPVLQRRHPDRHHLEQPLRQRAAGLRARAS